MQVLVVARRVRRTSLLLAAGTLLLTGCAGTQEPEVGRVASTFEDVTGDPAQRCDLLAPATLAALEESESALCADVIGDLPLQGGSVESVEVWGGDAQVKLTGDTLFLTETSAGWRVTSAVCRPRAEGPYDCEVDGS